MSAQAGWYPDPGGGQNLYRYWDGKAWSAATSPNPSAAPPAQGLVGTAPQNPALQPLGARPYTGQAAGTGTYGSGAYGIGSGGATTPGATSAGSAYAGYQQVQKRRSPVGWWLAGAALVLVVVVVSVFAVRAATGGGGFSGVPGGQGTQNACPVPEKPTAQPSPDPNDGRVHGGPVSYPRLGAPWGPPKLDDRVPFGSDALTQTVLDQQDYNGLGASWVASVLVAELQAGDGFFSPQQGSEVVVRCVLGTFYGDAAVTSDVKVNKKATIDGHDAWIVESQLSFDIPNLRAKSERLIVAVISAGSTSGLFYASIPNTKSELVEPAREAMAQLQVDG